MHLFVAVVCIYFTFELTLLLDECVNNNLYSNKCNTSF